jgi:hypothetical protein
LEEWDGFVYAPVGIAPDLASATVWVHELGLHESSKAALDPMSERPLSVQLADVIAGKIASGELAPDRPIPSDKSSTVASPET